MGLDLRLPIGLYFSILGVMLAIYGLITRADPDMYRRSLNLNINLTWGVVLLIFGLAMLIPALIDRRKRAGQ